MTLFYLILELLSIYSNASKSSANVLFLAIKLSFKKYKLPKTGKVLTSDQSVDTIQIEA